MKNHTIFKFLILFALLIFPVLHADAQTNFFRTCPGTNPTIKVAQVAVTKDGNVNIIPCATKSVLVNGVALSGLGTVQSVGLTLPSIFTVSNSPVNSSGNLNATLNNQTANNFFAAPSGASGAPVFRSIVTNDIPSLDVSKITTGTFAASFVPNLDAAKITTGTFASSFIPSLDVSKITTGTFAASFVPNLDAAKITTGTLDANRIPALPYLSTTSNGITPANNTFTVSGALAVTGGISVTNQLRFNGTNVSLGTIVSSASSTGTFNTFVGYAAGSATTSGNNNSFFGSSAGISNTTGINNVFFGSLAANGNTTGSSNTAIGSQAGYGNSTGSGNVFIGYQAGYYETGNNKFFLGNNNLTPMFSGDFAAKTLAIDATVTHRRLILLATGTTRTLLTSESNATVPISNATVILPASTTGVTFSFICTASTCRVNMPTGTNLYGLSGTSQLTGSASYITLVQGASVRVTGLDAVNLLFTEISNGTPTYTP